MNAVKPRPAANNGPENSSASESARSSMEAADRDSTQTEDSPNLLRRGAHHVRRGLNRAGVPQIAGHAARLGGHGWRRISTAVASANSGGRFSRPASAIWGRVARRPGNANAPAGDNPHGHRNRRLAFDFAVGTAAVAIFLMVHHQFALRSHRPRVASLLAATSDVASDPAAQDPRPATATHHRRRSHRSARPADGAQARPLDSHPGDPIALADSHRGLDSHRSSDGGAEFGDVADVGHRADHPVRPPVDVHVTSAPLDSQPHDPKRTADAALDSLLSAPVNAGRPHGGDAGAPMAQTEPPPSHDLDKPAPAHSHAADDPLLVDSREPGDSSVSHKHEHLKPAAVGGPVIDEFAAPEVGKPHEHHEHKDHGPKDGGPKDDFSLPAPGSSEPVDSPAIKVDSPPIKEDEHHHKHHQADHGPGDPPAGGDLPAPSAGKDADLLAPKLDAPLPDAGHSNSDPVNSSSAPKPGPGPSSASASDPLLDIDPKHDGPPKDALPPIKSSVDKFEPKADHRDDGLPVLSVPSPHHRDAKSHDDLGPPTRTANANDASIGDSPASKPPATKAPANDPTLDDLLNSKAPAGSGADPKTSGPPPASAAPEPKPSASVPVPPPSDSKGDPFHTEPAPHGDAAPKTDTAPKPDTAPKLEAAPKIDTPPKQAEPALPEISAPLPKPSGEPLHSAADEESMPSVAVAHHQIEKDETGSSVRYKIVVRNNGKKVVKTFEVDEAVPAEHTVQVTDPPAETRDRDLHWTLRDVAPGEERTIVVTLAPPVRTAEHLPVAEPTVAAQPIPAAASVPIEAKAETAQVKLELIMPVEVHAGESCRIGFRATNLGDKTADLKLNLDLPEQLHYERGQQLQYKIGALGDHEAREDYLTATAAGTGQGELRAQILQSGRSLATAKGTCHVAPAGAAHRGIQQTGAWTAPPSSPPRTAQASDCLCWP
jgi:hypothetical protein